MLNKNKFLLITIFFLAKLGMAQKNFEFDKITNFNEYCAQFEAQWNNKKPQKGDGYKQFKRWQWFMQDRVKLDGNLFNTAHVWREFETLTSIKKNSASSSRGDNDWKPLGPTSAEGSHTGVGRINCIAFHPSDEKTLFIGAAGGGIYKSIDEGKTWSSLNANLPSLSVSDIAIHPSNPDIIYIATGDADGNGNYPGGFSFGVMKSTDGGKSWSKTGLTFDYMNTKHIYRLIINPTDPSILIAASTNGLYKSSNDGSDWTKIIDATFSDVEFSPANDSTIYAVTRYSSKSYSKFYKSIDNGSSFSLIYEDSTTYRTNIAVSKNRPDDVWVLACNLKSYGGFNYIKYSKNNGPFELMSKDINFNILSNTIDGSGLDGQGSYDLAFAINPLEANEFLVGGISTWQSKNDGKTVQLVNYYDDNIKNIPIVHEDKHNLYYHPLNNKIYEANDGGIFVSDDNGITWRDLTKGMDIGLVWRMDYYADHLLAGHQDNGSKQINGVSWAEVLPGDGCDNAINRKNKDIQYLSQQFGQIYRTNDNWKTKKFISWFIHDTIKQRGNFVTPYSLHPESGNVYAGYQDLFRSTDNGDTWVNLTNVGFKNSIDQLAVSPIDEKIIYLSVTISGINYLLSELDGAIYQNVQNKITSIKCSPNDKNIVAVTFGGFENGKKVLISQDGGKNWVNISFDLPNLTTTTLEFQKGENGSIYVGNDFGVFKLNIAESKWELFSNNLPIVPITDMVIDEAENKLYISTFGRGIWVSEIQPPSTVSAVKDPQISIVNTSQKVTLSPNPFHDILKLKLDKALSYNVNIYDYKGQIVYKTKLTDKEDHALNLTSLTDGLYIIQLVNKDFTIAKQIIKH